MSRPGKSAVVPAHSKTGGAGPAGDATPAHIRPPIKPRPRPPMRGIAAQSFCRSARGASLARRARRGAIDLAFARRPASAGLGLGTRLCPFYVILAQSFYVAWKNRSRQCDDDKLVSLIIQTSGWVWHRISDASGDNAPYKGSLPVNAIPC